MKVTFPTQQLRKGFTLIELLVVIAIIALLASVAYGPILNQVNKGDQMQALSNMKNIGVAMNDFKSNSKLNNYPDDETAKRVLKANASMSDLGALEGTTSNDYFRQLLGDDSIDEASFYAKIKTAAGGSTATPDNKKWHGEALRPGEVGISYVLGKGANGKKVGLGGKIGPYPLMVTSVLSNEDGSTVVPGNAVRFDPDSFRGKVLVYRTDSSAVTLTLDDNDQLVDVFIPEKRGGKDQSDEFLILTPDFSGQE